MPVVSNYSSGNVVTSPHDKNGGRWMYSTRQKVPYVVGNFDKTYMSGRRIEVGSDFSWEGPNLFVPLLGVSSSTSAPTLAANAARSRLMARLQPARAAMAVNLATLDQSLKMIANRTNQIGKAFNHLRKGQFWDFLKVLSVGPLPKHRKRPPLKEQASQTWLEYTFGWKPLVQDIYSACDVLQSDFDMQRYSGTATMKDDGTSRGSYHLHKWERSVNVRMRAAIRVTNPNLALANQLGLLNPAAVVWDLIPFSFVVDWFVKVNRFVSTLNDMAGFDFINPITSTKYKARASVEQRYGAPYVRESRDGDRYVRVAGIPAPSFDPTFRLPMPSLWLAVTSSALAVGILSGSRK